MLKIVMALLLLNITSALAAPDLLLAKELPAHVEVGDYLISEKYDGVRAFWDGKALWFRGGGQINAPKWFINGLPSTALDGELWLARGEFEATSGIVRQAQPDDDKWRQIKFMIFELPNGEGDFATRVQSIKRLLESLNQPYLVAVHQYRLDTREQLQQNLEQIVKVGGEGLMLHLATAPYLTGRQDVLYKLKSVLDADATVVAHLKGKGKYEGMLGSLRVRTDDGREFNIGTGLSDAERQNPPAIGTLITYRYRGLTKKGLPRFASYWRVRQL